MSYGEQNLSQLSTSGEQICRTTSRVDEFFDKFGATAALIRNIYIPSTRSNIRVVPGSINKESLDNLVVQWLNFHSASLLSRKQGVAAYCACYYTGRSCPDSGVIRNVLEQVLLNRSKFYFLSILSLKPWADDLRNPKLLIGPNYVISLVDVCKYGFRCYVPLRYKTFSPTPMDINNFEDKYSMVVGLLQDSTYELLRNSFSSEYAEDVLLIDQNQVDFIFAEVAKNVNFLDCEIRQGRAFLRRNYDKFTARKFGNGLSKESEQQSLVLNTLLMDYECIKRHESELMKSVAGADARGREIAAYKIAHVRDVANVLKLKIDVAMSKLGILREYETLVECISMLSSDGLYDADEMERLQTTMRINIERLNGLLRAADHYPLATLSKDSQRTVERADATHAEKPRQQSERDRICESE